MRNLIALELKRNRLRPYHIATLICAVTMLGFQYLMAAIPYMDPTEPDVDLFSQYPFLMWITCLVCMAIFSILSAVMASRLWWRNTAGNGPSCCSVIQSAGKRCCVQSWCWCLPICVIGLASSRLFANFEKN